mmetsp:Transcript_23878/g.35035  ORF Transcript_23878/g.35035 Transcript_23878/m.35035 type:complete len:479 (+) Transcript_23878:40-1476(+)
MVPTVSPRTLSLYLCLCSCCAVVWVWEGCVDDALDGSTFTYARNKIGSSVIVRDTLRTCMQWGVHHNHDVIGLHHNGECYGCSDCLQSVMRRESRANCSDHGDYHRVQVFSRHEGDSSDSYTACNSDYPYICGYEKHWESGDAVDSSTGFEKIQHVLRQAPELEDMTGYYFGSSECEAVFHDVVHKTLSNEGVTSCRGLEDVSDAQLAEYTLYGKVPLHLFFVEHECNSISSRHNWPMEKVSSMAFTNMCFHHYRPYGGGSVLLWNEDVDGLAAIKQGVWGDDHIEVRYEHVPPNYKRGTCDRLFRSGQYDFSGATGVVFGSVTPWVEGTLLELGAASVTTIEYTPIVTDNPRLQTKTPVELAQAYLDKATDPVDFGVSYSTFEHSGLGRYGDPLDPWGDLRAMKQAKCLIKPGGILFLAVPTGPDLLAFNAHRIYGRHRLPYLLNGWEVVDVLGNIYLDGHPGADFFNEPFLVLRNI